MIAIILFALTAITSLNALKMEEATLQSISFDDSTSKSYAYDKNFVSTAKSWNAVRNLFNFYINKNLEVSKIPRIPKIIHWIWLGSPLPERCAKLQKSWKTMHPDWVFKLWTDKDVKDFKLQNQEFYDRATNWGEKSDIFRYEILYRHGGLYIDTDFECIKPFDILHHTCDFYTGIGYLYDVYLYNGLIGTVPGHPIIKACIDNMNPIGAPNDYDAIQYRTGPGHFTNNFFRTLPHCHGSKVVAFPVTCFYPIPNNQKDTIKSPLDVEKWIMPESFCIHYWACSWVK